MVHGSGQIGVRKCDTPERRTPQNLAGSRLTIAPKEEPGLRTEIGMSPAIQDNAGDVAPRVEAAAREHIAELLTDLALVIFERCSQQLCAAALPLLFGGSARVGVQNFQGEHDRRVWTDGWIFNARQRQLANVHVVAQAFKPTTTAHSQLVQKPPVSHRNVHHHAGGAVKLRIGLALGLREILHNVLGRPTTARHDSGARLHAIQLALLRIYDRNGVGFAGFPVMLDMDDSGRQSNSRCGSRDVQSGKVHAVQANSFHAMGTIDCGGDQTF